VCAYFCIPCLSWSTDDPTVSLEGIEFIAYPQERAAVRRVIDAVTAIRPHVKTMFHVAPNLYATNKPDEIWPDSRLIGPDGKQTVYDQLRNSGQARCPKSGWNRTRSWLASCMSMATCGSITAG